MSSYNFIRTKDYIYKVFNVKEYPKLPVNATGFQGTYFQVYGLDVPISEREVLKKGETLKELCEEFLIKNPLSLNGRKKPFIYEGDIDDLFTRKNIEYRKENNITCYGCIWVEQELPNGQKVWSLKPVAYFNDTGSFDIIPIHFINYN